MIDVIQVGLGPLGQNVVRFAQQRAGIRVVGAVDPAPDKAGRDLGEMCGLPPLGVMVRPTLPPTAAACRARVAILTTVSSIHRLAAQVTAAAVAGLHVVSTCEELSFPWRTEPELAARLDRVCRRHGIACVGTGVNPGFLMDYLPAVLSAVCREVTHVTVERIQDAAHRRVPFQQKIGAGLTPAQFRARQAAGTLRHVGLTESMHMLAHAMHWQLDRTTESLVPVIADTAVSSGFVPITPGMARGVEQVGRAFRAGNEVICLRFRAAVGESESYDRIGITGTPNVESRIRGGVHGDIATCAITLNAVPVIGRCTPGLKTMLDLPVPSCLAAP